MELESKYAEVVEGKRGEMKLPSCLADLSGLQVRPSGVGGGGRGEGGKNWWNLMELSTNLARNSSNLGTDHPQFACLHSLSAIIQVLPRISYQRASTRLSSST
jgi:hypothetical protein